MELHYKARDVKLNLSQFLSTKISHGSSDIREDLIRVMAFQCALSKSEFIDLVKCPLSEEAYKEILEKKGFLK